MWRKADMPVVAEQSVARVGSVRRGFTVWRSQSATGHGRGHGRLPPRRGAATLQLILVLPVLLLATIAIFQFGVLLLVQQSVTAAATEGARAAAREPTSADAQTAALLQINRVLAVHNLQLDPTSTDPNSDTRMVLEYGDAVTISTGDPDLACSPPGLPMMGPNEVRVTVCVDLTTSPFLNALGFFGFDFMGKSLEISCLVAQEL